MRYAGYVLTGYAVTAGVLIAYAGSILRRGRRLSRDVAPERRRWT
jgi:heme exporter protein CcmD